MDFYYTAKDDADAIRADDLTAGPIEELFSHSVEAKDIMACPHLEELVAIASGHQGPSLVPQLTHLWPEITEREQFEPAGFMITRLPDCLRDNLAGVEVTQATAERWAAELWSYEPDEAAAVAERITSLAREARDSGQSLYW